MPCRVSEIDPAQKLSRVDVAVQVDSGTADASLPQVTDYRFRTSLQVGSRRAPLDQAGPTASHTRLRVTPASLQSWLPTTAHQDAERCLDEP